MNLDYPSRYVVDEPGIRLGRVQQLVVEALRESPEHVRVLHERLFIGRYWHVFQRSVARLKERGFVREDSLAILSLVEYGGSPTP